ncbi:hypothetical protein Bbelb_270930 [Branchiostoma belcheri]|nr:hypothetical protein Bbelb_270930 [Branchiostoma belcheri]
MIADLSYKLSVAEVAVLMVLPVRSLGDLTALSPRPGQAAERELAVNCWKSGDRMDPRVSLPVGLLLLVMMVTNVTGQDFPVGLWPLNSQYGASDVTGNGNDGVATGVSLAPGPNGDPDGAFLFSGNSNSYLDIPNNGRLDVQYSYTILAHIYPSGQAGPIIDFTPNTGWGVHLWQTDSPQLFMRAVRRDGYITPAVAANVLQQNTWNYVGGTYDSSTGVEAIWNNGEVVGRAHVGIPSVATQYPIRVAVRNGDHRMFAGRIACIQMYNFAMTQEQIVAARDKCAPAPKARAIAPQAPLEPE